jgi:hypothetical protein
MTQTAIQKSFAPFKRFLPSWAWKPIRSIGTAFIGPILAAHRTGYFRSSLKMAAVSKKGQPMPWYTYPSIDFLKYRSYEDKTILEFGGGQSTLWWSGKARHVITLEGDRQWYEKIRSQMPSNVDLCYVSMENSDINVSEVMRTLESKQNSKYDVIVIDGLYRFEMISIALSRLADDGIIICDNAEGYGFFEGFRDSGLWRVDFFGNAPGVVLPHATSIYFRPSSCFIFDAKYPIPVIAKEP